MTDSSDAVRAENVERRLSAIETTLKEQFVEINRKLDGMANKVTNTAVEVALIQEREKNMTAMVVEMRRDVGVLQKENDDLKAVLKTGKVLIGMLGISSLPNVAEFVSAIGNFVGH